MTGRARRINGLAGILAVVLTIAACGGGSGNKSSNSSSGGSSNAPSAGASVDLSAVKATVDKALQRPTSINITAKLNGAPVKNKTIDWLQCSVPACVALTPPLRAATNTVGWKLNVVDAGVTPQTIRAAWDKAVSDKPDAVIASGFSRTLFNTELAKLKAANIPVIDLTTADSPGNGLTAVFDYGPDYLASGQRLADYALAQAGTDVNALMVTSSAFENLSFVAKGFKDELNKQCPSCAVSSMDVPATSIGKDLPTRVTAYLTAHPKVNWAYIGYDDMVLGLPAAMSAAGLSGKVKLVTIDNEPATQAYMKNKQGLVASDGFPGPEIMWRTVDFLLRDFSKQDTSPSTAHNLPVWLLTGDNVPSTTSSFPLVADYQQQYKALWGMS
jgi:ribose transport system substrate-binding protein